MLVPWSTVEIVWGGAWGNATWASREGQSVSLLCGSVSGRAQRGNSAATLWPLEICLRGSCLLALVVLPVTSHSPCMPLLPFQLLSWCWIPEGMGLHKSWDLSGPFKGSLLIILQFLPPANPHWFLQQEVMGTYLCDTGSLGWVVWSGAGIAHSQGIPHDFYPPRMNVGQPIPLPLCISASPIWMNVAILNLWSSDFHTAHFSDKSGWDLFYSLVVIFAAVVQIGKACLPTPPSWLEVKKQNFKEIYSHVYCSLIHNSQDIKTN